MTDQRVVMAADAAAGAVRPAVAPPGRAAQEPVATTGRDVAQLLDVDVDQGAGLGVLVAADGLAGGPVQSTQPADAAADQDGMDGRGRQPDLGGDLGWPSRFLQRRWTIRRTSGAGVRRGLWWGGWTGRPSQPAPGLGSAGPTGGRWVG